MNKNRQKVLMMVVVLIIAFGLYYFFKQNTTNSRPVPDENLVQDQFVNTVNPEPVAPVVN